MCFVFKQKTAFDVEYGLVGSEMGIRDRRFFNTAGPFGSHNRSGGRAVPGSGINVEIGSTASAQAKVKV